MRILVVDDEPAVRDSLERALRLDGYEVELAADGREGLERCRVASADAIVLDVLMPEIDGLEVCRRLRADGDRIPILMLTARDGVSDRVAGLDAGADDYLVKPFALEELQARLRALLRRSGADGEESPLRFGDLPARPRGPRLRKVFVGSQPNLSLAWCPFDPTTHEPGGTRWIPTTRGRLARESRSSGARRTS